MSTRHRVNELRRLHKIVTALADGHPRLIIAASDLTRAWSGFATACHALQDARPGLPGAASYDGDRVTGGGSTDQIVRLLDQNGTGDIKDPNRHDRELLDDSLHALAAALTPVDEPAIRHHAAVLRRIVIAWTPRQPSDKQRRAVEAANHGAPECAIVRSVLGIYEPAYRTSNLGGLLPEAEPVGRWVYDESRRRGRLPTHLELRTWASRKDGARQQLIGGRSAGR